MLHIPALNSLRDRRCALAVVAALLALSCATEAPPRSFVQPNALRKTDFNGTFYYLQTVTDAPPTNGAMFIGQSSSMLKIRFDIEQNYLYARRAYPQVYNSESDTVLEGDDYMGEPLAAWVITSQFDIIRQYNSETGEQTNEIIEDQERPWEEREFFRVDWSKNLITDYVGLGMDLFFSDGQPTVEPVSYWQSDPSQPDALHMEHLTANSGGLLSGDMNYMDITNEMIITPEVVNAGGFVFPKCFLYYADDDCASQLVKVRHSFTKIDPTHAYESEPWDGTKMNLYGVWDVGLRHLTYNQDYGITNTGVARYAARFNIWNQASYKDQNHLNDDPTKLMTQKIPYYAAGSMAVQYDGDPRFPDGYQDSIYPPDLWNEFTQVVGQWNSAMQQAVIDRTTPANGTPAASWPYDIFVPCHNPVAPGDDPACSVGLVPDLDANSNPILDKQGNQILHIRAGDPRHSYVYWVDQPQAAGPLGYGPPMYDEQTGETISGHAYIYGASLETYATRCRDLLLLLNGEVSESDYIAGQPAINWVSQYQAGTGGVAPVQERAAVNQTRPFRNWQSYSKPLNPTDVRGMANAMNFDWALGFTPKNGYPAIDPTSVASLIQSIQSRQDAMYNGFFSNFSATRDQLLQSVVGTPLESMMITPELFAINGVSPNLSWDQLTAAQQTQVSPLRWKDIQTELAQDMTGAEIRGVDFDEGFDDVGMQERLRYYEKKYNTSKFLPIQDQLNTDLTHSIFLAVTLHEVGHNMGCRHNFRASWDALNYQPSTDDPVNGHTPGYWELRTGALQHPDPGMEPSDGQLHPRYINKPGGAVTQYEMDNQVQEMQYTSIMDYGSEFYSDLHGLGMYDKAIIKFSYAGYVEVFTDIKTDSGSLDQGSEEAISALQQQQSSYGVPSPLGSGANLSAIAYQTYPNLFNSGWQGIYKRADVPYSQIQGVALGNTGDTVLVDSLYRPLVPYYFCSDEFAGAGMTCQRFDSGADAYEQATDIISRYENFYIYNNFKRDRQTFHTTNGYLSRVQSRYFDVLRQQLTWYVLWRSLFTTSLTEDAQGSGQSADNVQQAQNQFFVDENGWGNFTAAVSLGYQMLGDVITKPNAGLHFQATAPDGTPYWEQINDELSLPSAPGAAPETLPPNYQFIGLLDGKYPNTTWDFMGCGYYWADECQERIGYLLDKEVAMDELSQSQAYFTGRDTSTDIREYAIGYVIPFKAQLEEKVGAILANDLTSLAPQFVTTTSGTMVPSQPDWLMDNPTLPNADPIDPQTGFTLQLWAGLFSLAAFPTTFDHTFINNTQIFIVGNGEAPVSDAWLLQGLNGTTCTGSCNATYDPSELVANGGSYSWFLFTDPTSGQQFGAHSVPTTPTQVVDYSGSSGASSNFQEDTVGLRADIGVRMLERLWTLNNVVNSYASAPATSSDKQAAITNYQNYIENIQIMRALQNAFGYGSFLPDANQYF